MIHLTSENVKVFPFGTPRTFDTDGNTLSEHNFASIVRRLTDKPSYVLSYLNDELEFVIDGYYFKASNLTTSFGTNDLTDIHAAISLVGNSTKFLDGGDSTVPTEQIILAISQSKEIKVGPDESVVILCSKECKDDLTLSCSDDNFDTTESETDTQYKVIVKNKSKTDENSFTITNSKSESSLTVLLYTQQDTLTLFTGLMFYSGNETIPEGYKSLHVLTKNNSTWAPPITSLLKYNPESLHIDVIQCKV